MKLLCFASFHLLHVSAATAADEEVDESCALQVRGEVRESPKEKPDSCGPSYFLSILASEAMLKVETTATKDGKNGGSLTMTGPGVVQALIMADRPVRKVAELDTDDFVSVFQVVFSSQTGGFPNAVLSGKVKGAGMKDVALVLVGATYSVEGPTLTLKWRSDDDIIDGDLDFDFASLFVDSFFHHFEHFVHNVFHGGIKQAVQIVKAGAKKAVQIVKAGSKKAECHVAKLPEITENALCKKMAGEIVKEGAKKLICTTDALADAGFCTLINADDGEILDAPCTAAIVGVCTKVVSKMSKELVGKLTHGRVSTGSACKAIGYGDPCA